MPGCNLATVVCVVYCQAAARHHCSYLVNIHSTEFLLQHGDEQWLKGVQHAPAKLQRLNDVNRILAHRPWLITTDHIQVNLAFRHFGSIFHSGCVLYSSLLHSVTLSMSMAVCRA